MPTPFWHTQIMVDGLRRLDRPGYAVEFLRRNPRYREGHTTLARRMIEQPERAAEYREDWERRWGLFFRT